MSHDLEPGQDVAGRYRLGELIGRGAVGSVWRAHDHERGHEVALKTIVPLDSEGRVSRNKLGRFIREARAMQRLKSPYVVTVYDHGSGPSPSNEFELVYISMELLEGESLRQRLKRDGPLDVPQTLRVLKHVGRAVALAHERGIVHRDLKPANIFLCKHRELGVHAKVLDFGMVKSTGLPLATVDPVKTELGRPIGTPYYMSPEQARGQGNVDHRTDLWAMGVIAFECLTGTRPFKGKSLARVFTEIATGPLPVPSDHGPVPPGFDAWFRRAVCRDIQQRFQSVRTLMAELKDILAQDLPPTSQASGLTLVTVADIEPVEVSDSFSDEPTTDRTFRRQPQPASSSFVGREESLAKMDEAIDSHCRVLTLRGFDGMGRARLAREYGRRRAERYPGGVWICSLADVDDPDSMWLELAAVVGVVLGEGEPTIRIGRGLSGLGRVLIVITDIDGVRGHLASALGRWLGTAPRAVFIVSSKRPLALPTERVLRVPALEFPPENVVNSLRSTRDWTATQLLLRRAISFNRTLLGSERYAPAIGNLAWRVQGNPLGIELLASCTAAVDPVAMVHQLGTLHHQAGTQIIRPDAVLEGIMLWVLEQLEPVQRAVLLQLSTFWRGFDADAAEAVLDLSAFPEARATDSLLRRLAKRSLLQTGLDVGGNPRFSIHPTLLALLRAQLWRSEGHPNVPPDVRDAVAARHGRYYAQLGEPDFLDSMAHYGGVSRRAQLMSEIGNLRVAMERAAERRDGRTAALCSLALATVDHLVGRHGAAAKRLVGPAGVAETPPVERVRCLVAQSHALVADGRIDAAERSLGRALQEAGVLTRPRAIASLHEAQATVALATGDIPRAAHATEALAALAEASADPRLHADAALWHARLARRHGDPQISKQWYQRAWELYHHHRVSVREAVSLEELAKTFVALGRHEAAGDALERALHARRELGDRRGMASVLGELGEQALERGDNEGAMAQLEQAARRCQEIGAVDLEGRFLGSLATALSVLDRPADARHYLMQAEQLLRYEGDHVAPDLAEVLFRRAALALRFGDRTEARYAYGEALTIVDQMPLAPGEMLERMQRSLAPELDDAEPSS